MRSCFVLILLISLTGSLYAQYDSTYFTPEEDEYTSDYTNEEEEDHSTYTQGPADLNTTKNYSSEKITIKKFDNKKWKEVTGTTDYRNERLKQKSKTKAQKSEGASPSEKNNSGNRYTGDDDDSLDDYEELESDSENSSGVLTGFLLKFIFYSAILFIIGLIVYYIIKNTSFKPNPKNPRVNEQSLEEPVENIADLDVDTLLERTQAAGNYRLAVRLYFLGLLKKLNEGGFISWKKDKTNRDYLSELYTRAMYFDEVRRLTLAYERVWYGSHGISMEAFNQLSQEFKAIDQQLNRSKTP